MLNRLVFILRNKKTYVILYVLFLALSVTYVRSVLKNVKVDVSEKNSKKESFEVKPASVELIIQTPTSKTNYKLELKNVDSVLDLVDEIRKTKNLKYEKTEYIYGTEITSVYEIEKTLTHRWTMWSKSADGTVIQVKDFNKQKLSDGTKYLVIYQNIADSISPEF